MQGYNDDLLFSLEEELSEEDYERERHKPDWLLRYALQHKFFALGYIELCCEAEREAEREAGRLRIKQCLQVAQLLRILKSRINQLEPPSSQEGRDQKNYCNYTWIPGYTYGYRGRCWEREDAVSPNYEE